MEPKAAAPVNGCGEQVRCVTHANKGKCRTSKVNKL